MKNRIKISLAVFFFGMVLTLASCGNENVSPAEDTRVNAASTADTCKTTGR